LLLVYLGHRLLLVYLGHRLLLVYLGHRLLLVYLGHRLLLVYLGHRLLLVYLGHRLLLVYLGHRLLLVYLGHRETGNERQSGLSGLEFCIWHEYGPSPSFLALCALQACVWGTSGSSPFPPAWVSPPHLLLQGCAPQAIEDSALLKLYIDVPFVVLLYSTAWLIHYVLYCSPSPRHLCSYFALGLHMPVDSLWYCLCSGGGPLHPPIPLLGGPGVKHFFPSFLCSYGARGAAPKFPPARGSSSLSSSWTSSEQAQEHTQYSTVKYCTLYVQYRTVTQACQQEDCGMPYAYCWRSTTVPLQYYRTIQYSAAQQKDWKGIKYSTVLHTCERFQVKGA